MTRLLIVRHGETDYNRQNRIQGQKDISLNKRGLEEAVMVASRLSRVNFIQVISSDLSRAWETARIISSKRNVVPVADKRLRELGFGDLEGHKWDEIKKLYPMTLKLWENLQISPVPNGEPPFNLIQRVKEFISTIPYRKNNPIVIVAHGGSIRTMISLLTSTPIGEAQKIKLNNASITEGHLSKNTANIVCINSVSHLQENIEV
ncbi:MAG: histidine phosphatase family protein [bacterium]|nr:histidine phosphatase family protein [bacterium]